ncbi:unnamed protein product [Schistosoma curassoni]|uniref:DUF1758 domain-containing protein n=1 Tax=Schistosoma curassoni TaxID=6186 RepID=A0A183KBC9_9TREM|nr:unnamed protein product [Schistosoma curassoni]
METRSKRLKENDEMDGKISKAVCGMSDVNDDKCDVSINSMSSSQLSTSRLKLDKALLRRRNLEKRRELERKLKMLDLQEEVDIAELECKAIEDDERLPVDKCGINAQVCLGIVPVRLYGPKGCLETYALLDSGSDTSLVCEELINQLGIKGKETSIRVATVNGTTNCDCLEVN